MNLANVFAILKPDQGVDTLPVSEGFYEALDREYGQFQGHVLVSMYTFTRDWPSWECHPAGDEVVVLLDGEATMVCELDDGASREMPLGEPGSYVVIPRNTWHTAKVPHSARMLFVTPGEGTQHRNGGC